MGGFMTAYMAGGRMDPPFMPTKTYPHIKGIRVPVSGADPLVTDVYQVTKDAELVSLAIACSRYDDNDHWSFYINGKQVCDSIYTKELPEGLFFTVIIPLKQGDELRFEFHNVSQTTKSVWLNYQMLT